MKDLLEATIGNCIFCSKNKLLYKGICGSCRKDIEEEGEIEEGYGICPGCRTKTDEEELSEFQGICYDCYQDALNQEIEDNRHPDKKQVI